MNSFVFTFLLFLIKFVNANKTKIDSYEELDFEPSAAEFYVADESDDDSCLINKEENLSFYCHKFTSDYDELSYFNPGIEARILEFAVNTNRKLLVIYTLISKSAKQRQELIAILEAKNGKSWLKNLKNVGSRVWKNSAKIINALITPSFEFNAKMLNKRFDFMTNSVSKLYHLIPEAFQAIFKNKKNIFNSYMLTEILLESNIENRKNLKNSYFLKYKKNLEDEITSKLNKYSSKFHIMLLNETRFLPSSQEKIDTSSTDLKLDMFKHLKIHQSRKDFKTKYLINVIGKNSPQVLTEAFEKFRQTYGYSVFDRLKKNCMKMSFIDLAVKFLHDPYAYYASHIKILLDQKDFGYYLSRLFFAYPKQKLQEISKSFENIYKAPLKDYIKSRLNELKPSSFDKITGRNEQYESYLRALLASIGDVDWCDGSCRVTQTK